MRSVRLTMALVGVAGLLTACGGGGPDEAGGAAEETGANRVDTPLERAHDGATGAVAAEGTHTLTFTVAGMS